MSFSYKPLWKLLIDRDMSKKDLMKETKISKSTMDKMGRSEIVSLEIIDRICNYFHCSIEDVVEHRQQEEGQNGK
ncbi:MAG: helix-turn-helix transcriptional regulator [Eubacteriales bacterium]|nr:helix-turn-helix transcriptional regulator [Eubacteriales bacterium]